MIHPIFMSFIMITEPLLTFEPLTLSLDHSPQMFAGLLWNGLNCTRTSCWACGILKIFTRLNPWNRNYDLCLHRRSKIFKRSQCLSSIQWWLVRKCGSERDNQQPSHSWSLERSFGVFKIFLGFLADAGMEMRIWYCTRIPLQKMRTKRSRQRAAIKPQGRLTNSRALFLCHNFHPASTSR